MTVSALLARGADPNVTQGGGWTPLHAAARHGDAAMARALLEHGARPGTRSDDGKTAADLATKAGHEELVALLASATDSADC